ncbi:VgrG-related protein [Streptomyces sp. NPDC058579]|uniref:VgrG-related protein n=1 Tax=Streptomyces sp. NPDC058579 TaxID=3346548 RepID=UPI0036578BC9
MSTHHTASLIALVDGRPLPSAHAELLAWAAVEESTHASAHAEIGFRDPQQAALLKATGMALGGLLELRAQTADGTHDLFEGEITGCEARAGDTTGVFTVVRADDRAHRLKRGNRTVAYTQMSAHQIAEKIAGQYGLRTGSMESKGAVYDFLTQPAMSDWDFLRHLARENGCDVYVRAGALHFHPPSLSAAPALGTPAQQSPFALEFGANLLKVSSAATTRGQVGTVLVRGWDPEKKEPLTATGEPGSASVHEVPWRSESTAVREEPGLPRASQDEVEQVARAGAQRVADALSELTAVVRGEPRIRLRSTVALTGLGEQFQGRYAVTSVRHVYHPEDGYLSELTVGEGDGAEECGAGLRRFFGLVPGTVVNIQDPGKQGRVKVQLPWLSETYESNWARTVQLGGSGGYGAVLPEVKDEVLVGFEQGCVDRPYVLGGLYNGVDKPRPAQSGLELYDGTKGVGNRRSFASKEGHRLELLDAGAQGMGAVLVSGDDKLRIQLDQHQTLITVHSDGKVEIAASKGITLDAGDGPLELKGQDITLSGRNVDIAANVDAKVSGGKTVTVKGGMNADVTAALVRIN